MIPHISSITISMPSPRLILVLMEKLARKFIVSPKKAGSYFVFIMIICAEI
jgi:hypothetical protein